MQMITACSRKCIIKPNDKESKDTLRAIVKGNRQIQEKSPLWPGVSMENVESHFLLKRIAIKILHLDNNLKIANMVINPLYKKSPCD